MPQKPIFSKHPLLSVTRCFPSPGTVRTSDERIVRLYETSCMMPDEPCLWEGLFRLACLLKNKPLEEPVAGRIKASIAASENGSFEGTLRDQLYKARAAFAVFEYTTDRDILKRIALWLRYLEIEFDQITRKDGFLYQCADLMELLIRFYQATGLKSVLRLCSRLRASSFDWTTSLHTFQQSIPISFDHENDRNLLLSVSPDELDYTEKEKLINHAEMLADGIRYTLYSGVFSGHRQDLSAGRIVWEYLKKHHRALCGGTTSNPYLCGNASDQPVSNSALAAWCEAFACQLILDDSDWALNELIRIVFNGLEDCLSKKDIPDYQYINTVKTEPSSDDPIHLYGRITRAVSQIYTHAISLTQDGVRINYTVPARYLILIAKQSIILNMNESSALFQSRDPFTAAFSVFHSDTETRSFTLIRNECQSGIVSDNIPGNIFWATEKGLWKNQDGFIFSRSDNTIVENTHHQGICFLAENRLLSFCPAGGDYPYAFCSGPDTNDGRRSISVSRVSGWRDKDRIPCDIPVLPGNSGTTSVSVLRPYSELSSRITMLPRTRESCLK